MKALIFAAGLGTRLKPWTEHHPKALVPLGGEPMLGRVICKLRGYGISDIVVNVHHFADQIADYLASEHNFGINIQLSDERHQLLDTGGGLLKAAPLLRGNDRILIHNADILTDFNLSDMERSAISTGAMSTLLVKERNTSRYLAFDDGMRLQGWTNIDSGEVRPADKADLIGRCRLRAFGGVHIVTPDIFEPLERYNKSLVGAGPARDMSDGICKFSIIDFYISTCDKNKFIGFEPAGEYRWFDIGKAATLEAAENYLDTASQS